MGKLVAKIHTNDSQSGIVKKHIAVRTNAKDFENVRLNVTAKLETPIQVVPRYQLHINTMIGKDGSDKVLLHRDNDAKLEVTLPEKLPEGVSLKVTRAGENEGVIRGITVKPGDLWLHASLDAPEKPVTLSEKLVIKTNHPRKPELVLPLTIQVRSLIEPRPSQVRMWYWPDRENDNGTVFRLTHNRGQDFEIKEVASSRPDLISASIIGSGPQRMHNLRAVFAKDADLEALALPVQAELTITTTDPAAPEVKVPIVIMERAAPHFNQPRIFSQEKSRSARPIPGNLVRPTPTPHAN